MKYLVEPIGAEFSDKDLVRLAKQFDERAREGYRLLFVFQVQQPGCLGIGSKSVTYVAVYGTELAR